ncbi:ANTAR domain-containing protein [Streptomyces sp. SGAir0957]
MRSDEAMQSADLATTSSNAHTAALEREITQLKEAVVSHADVDRAVGVLIGLARLSPAQGFDVLREVSQRTNTKLRHVALLTIQRAQGGLLPARVYTELYRQLRARTDTGEPTAPPIQGRPLTPP